MYLLFRWRRGHKRHQGRLVSPCIHDPRDRDIKVGRSSSVVAEDDLSVQRMRIELLTTSGKWTQIILDLLLGNSLKRFVIYKQFTNYI